MSMQKFNLQTLVKLDGSRVVEAWNQAVERVMLDLEDRPHEDKAREVCLKLKMTPVPEQGSLESINFSFDVTDSVPKRKSKTYNGQFRRQQGRPTMLFNDLADENAQQRTLDEMTPFDEENPPQ